MKKLPRSSVILMVAAIVLLNSEIGAGEKKDKDKKPEVIVVNETLTTADLKDKVRMSSYCKTFVFEMKEGKNYQLDMTSGVFDSYLRLENPTGEQVAADDDGGGYPSARIIYRAPKTGDFTIICTTFGANSTGKFMLTVKEIPNN